MDKIAIQVTDVEKIYKLYDKPSDRLREALGRIRDRYVWCYRANGYSRWYLVECIAIECVKMVFG